MADAVGDEDRFQDREEDSVVRAGRRAERVEIDRVAELIALPKPKVEKKLAQMILDKKLTGVLAQGEGRLMLHTEPNEDPTYEASLAVIKNTADVVESLFGRAEALDS